MEIIISYTSDLEDKNETYMFMRLLQIDQHWQRVDCIYSSSWGFPEAEITFLGNIIRKMPSTLYMLLCTRCWQRIYETEVFVYILSICVSQCNWRYLYYSAYFRLNLNATCVCCFTSKQPYILGYGHVITYPWLRYMYLLHRSLYIYNRGLGFRQFKHHFRGPSY